MTSTSARTWLGRASARLADIPLPRLRRVLLAPFAWMPWPLALMLWSTLNAMLLFVAVERLLPARRALLAIALLPLEVLRGMQNAQSNALVAALIVVAFVAMERHHAWRAALAVGLGACVKIFPLAALTFAIPRR